MVRTAAIIACLLLVGGVAWAYPENYASIKLGASVVSPAEIDGKRNPTTLLSDAPVPKGQIAFAPIDQRQVLTIDLSDLRIFDRVDFGTGFPDGSRAADRLRIEVSRKSLQGPYEPVFEGAGLGYFQVLRLPRIRARWVRLDLGKGAGGFSIHSLRIYRSQEHPRLSEVARLLSERVKPALPELKPFHAAVDARDWSRVCAVLRSHCAQLRPPQQGPNPGVDLSMADRLAAGELSCAGVSRRELLPVDWARLSTSDWIAHRSALSRGDVLAVAADACSISNDQGRARYLKSLFYDWIDANPRPTEMNGDSYPTWRSSDTAARLKILISRFPMVTADRNIDDEMWANWLLSIWEHADYLANDTFSVGESAASAAAAVTTTASELPFFAREQEWLTYGQQSLDRMVLRDVASDGKIVDDSPAWVALAYTSLTEAVAGLQKAGKKVGSDLRERVGRMPKFLSAVTLPGGELASFGEEVPRYGEGCKPAIQASTESLSFPMGGWCVMRAECDLDASGSARQLILKASRGPHGHCDSLAVSIHAFGRVLICDGGSDARTSSHSTTCVDSQDQPDLGGRLDRWFSNSGVDWAVASHHAYKDLTLIRSIVFVKPDYWLVRDELESDVAGVHTLDQIWWCGPDTAFAEGNSAMSVSTTYPSGANICVAPVDSNAIVSPSIDSTASPTRNRLYRKTGNPPITIDTLLRPVASGPPPTASARLLNVEGSGRGVVAFAVTSVEGTDYVIASRKGPQVVKIPDEQITVDAEVAVIRVRDDRVVRISGGAIKRVDRAGVTLFSRDQPEANVDVGF